MYNFHNFMHVMGYNNKLLKYKNANNPERLKDYICAAYDAFPPSEMRNHPCYEVMEDCIHECMNPAGWKVKKTRHHGDFQICCISPNGDEYYSHYDYDNSDIEGCSNTEVKKEDKYKIIALEICAAYDVFPASEMRNHTLYNLIECVVHEILNPAGWKVKKTRHHGDIQICCISPNGDEYYSHYDYKK